MAGPEFTLEVVRRAAGLDERNLARGARRRGAQRNDRGDPRDRARVPLHARARAAGALRPPERPPARRAAPAGRDRAGGGRSGRLRPGGWRTWRTISRRRAPLGDPKRAVDYNLRAARAAMAALAFEQAAGHFRTALALGVESPSEQAEIQLELGTACHAAGSWGEAIEAFTAAAEIGRAAGDAGHARARRDRVGGGLLGRGHRSPCGAGAARGGERRPSAGRNRRSGSVCSRPSLACSPTAETTRAPRSSARTRSRWRAGSATGTALATLLSRAYYGSRHEHARGHPRNAHRGARPSRTSSGDSRSNPIGNGVAGGRADGAG